MAWAQNNWHDPQAAADRIAIFSKEPKLRWGKGKTVICAVSGAALIAAQQSGHINRQIESGTIKSLQDLVQALQEQLGNEVQSLSDGLATKWITNQRLENSLAESLEREKILRNSWRGPIPLLVRKRRYLNHYIPLMTCSVYRK